MFNVIEKHQKVVKGIMITITATFVVWGISGYLGMAGDDGYVAKVGSNKIYTQDIDRAIDQSQGQQTDKMQTLFGLINRQLLINSLQDHHMSVTREQLVKAISAVPMFQTNGQFDATKYEQFLKQQYTTSAKFEADITQQLLIEQMLDFFKSTYFASNTFQTKFAQLLSRERNVSQYVVDPKQFYAKIQLSESDINSYYQQNIQQFTLPEQVKLQYIQLSVSTLASSIKVTDDQINKYLQDHPDMASNKQIDASHILFNVPANATPAQKAQIKATAEKVLAEVNANPNDFAKLAKEYSQDPGSADKGGELGTFGKGVMVKPFEEVAFSLKPGQISGLVETQFGYHIIKLNSIKGDDIQSIHQAVAEQIQKQQAQQKIQGIVDQLNDITYNQPDSLNPAAQKTGLTVQSSDWLAKGDKTGLLANPKLVQAVFVDDVLKQHHNTEVIDMGDGSYIVARAVDYKPATVKPLDTVKDQIVTALKQQQAAQMAAALGQQDLQQLQQGQLKLAFSNAQDVTLLGQSKDIDPMAVKQIFTASNKFPSYAGAMNKDGAYVIYQINSEKTDSKFDEQNKNVVNQMASQYAMMNLNSYVGALRSDYKVTYKLDRIKGSNDAGQDGGSNQ